MVKRTSNGVVRNYVISQIADESAPTVVELNRNRIHSSKLASLVILAIHQAPKREAFVCCGASPRLVLGRRSRELAPGWQTKGGDITLANARPTLVRNLITDHSRLMLPLPFVYFYPLRNAPRSLGLWIRFNTL